MRFWKPMIALSLVVGLVLFFLFRSKDGGRVNEQNSSVIAQGTPGPGTAVPPPAPSSIPHAPQKLNEHDQHQFTVLNEILTSHNDNDPRFDTELTHLSPELKSTLMSHYEKIAAEKRNDRGTIVFLMGRELSSSSDLNFMKSVLMEKPCQSLGDCKSAGPPITGEAEHLQGINETTANYPQLNAIRALVNSFRAYQAQNPPDTALSAQVIQILQEATHSPNPKVVQEAENALRALSRQ